LYDDGQSALGSAYVCLSSSLPFLSGERNAFARAAADIESTNALFNQMIDDTIDLLKSQATVFVERRDSRRT
jgi:hypothetical protein